MEKAVCVLTPENYKCNKYYIKITRDLKYIEFQVSHLHTAINKYI